MLFVDIFSSEELTSQKRIRICQVVVCSCGHQGETVSQPLVKLITSGWNNVYNAPISFPSRV